MTELRRWEIVLSLAGFWFARRKARAFLAEQARIGALWRNYYDLLRALGSIDMRTLTYVAGPYAGRAVEDVAAQHGICAPAERVLCHPFELFKKVRP